MQNADNESDESLLARIQNGDEQAFSLLVQRHADRFYGLVWRLTSGSADCEEVVQEAFLKLWQRPDSFKAAKGVKFTTWFYRVVSNLSLDYLRKNKRQWPTDPAELVNLAATDNSEAQIILTERQALLEAAIQTLPERQKMALSLCVYEELSNKEAAVIMKVKVKALESLLMRAKAHLKKEIQYE